MTLKDVANVSGCSVATVSKVFKNSAEISEETKERVLSAAKRIGYLKKVTSRPAILGGQKPVVFADPKNTYLSSLYDIKKSADRNGLTLVYVMSDDSDALELSQQIGAWGLVVVGHTRLTAENVFSFSGDISGLFDYFEKISEYVPKRPSRAKTDSKSKTKAPSNKPKAEEPKVTSVKKSEEIWLL